MPIVDNNYIPEADVTERKPDGRRIMLWPEGRPMPLAQAYEMGLLVKPAPVIPSETKRLDAEGVSAQVKVETADTGAPTPAVAKPAPAGLPVTGPNVLAPDPIDATATAKQLAKQHGINLRTVTGTGKGGRITKYDVEEIVRAQG